MNQSDFFKSPTVQEIIDEWSESNPWVAQWNAEDLSIMIARRMAKLAVERIPRRVYYDLYEFRAR